jgi:hypothetical protein
MRTACSLPLACGLVAYGLLASNMLLKREFDIG